MTNALGPRLVVAGTRSGDGKTTIATGLMTALRRRGRRVAPAKVGPDFIDPGYHSLATGRPGRNLDMWMAGAPDTGEGSMTGPASVERLAGRAAAGADLLVVEGVMGLFDGAADGTPSSTAQVAKLLDAPVVLVVNAASVGQSVAATVHGFAHWDPALRLAGVILNYVASDSHEKILRDALASQDVPVLGAVRRDEALSWRERNLGLTPVAEHPEAVRRSLDRLASRIEEGCDLEGIAKVAAEAPHRAVPEPPLPSPVVEKGTVRVAVAGGAAFSFLYPDNVEALEAAGAEVVTFDPRYDEQLPEGAQALVAGGGFPEVFATDLAANTQLLSEIRDRHAAGMTIWAECGGLLWLTQKLDGRYMAGVVPASGSMTGKLSLGYRQATTTVDSPLGPAGTAMRGHEFHYSTTDPAGTALKLTGRQGTAEGGYANERLMASYLHLHLGAEPEIAAAFVKAADSN